jgi:putative redox protein
MAATTIKIPTGRGHELAASLDTPEGEPRAYALFAHCFTCNKDYKFVRAISKQLAAAGVAVLRFDFTGLGSSGGSFGAGGFLSDVADLKDAAQWLADNYSAPSLLVGHSLGGAAVLMAAPELSSVRAVVTVGAPSSPEILERHFEQAAERLEEEGEVTITVAGREFTLTRQFLEETRGLSLVPALRELDAALLVCHSPADEIVPVDNAARIFKGAQHPKSYLSLAGADHLLSKPGNAEYVASVAAAWAEPYISG